ncbi:MAG: DUF1573 domain-containing protein [Bacteroidota bacterium]
MKKSGFILSLLVFCSISLLVAQNDHKISFDKTTHDFGTMDKNDLAETVFTFTNTSESPLKLTNVKASCGCTTPFYTKESIAPGETGEVKVKYNTARMGAFTKSVTVRYDTAKTARPIILYIKGKVVEGEPQEAAINYNHVVGGIAFDQINPNVGTLDSDKEKLLTFNIRNISPTRIQFKPQETVAEAGFLVSMGKTDFLPGETGIITVRLVGEEMETMGPFRKQVVLTTTEDESNKKTFTINGNLNKVYSAEELALMPSIKFEQVSYDAGKILSGEKVTHGYIFTNEGKGDLKIESVKASCGCTATAPKDKIIKPGESSEIMATFDSRGRSGVQQKSITVKTNDPDQATVILRLKATVEKDPFHISSDGPAASPAGSPFNN